MVRTVCCLAVVAIVLLAIPVTAQSVYGELRGTVRDPSGEPLAGVAVEVASSSIAGVRTAETDGLGGFRVVPLEPGLYRVELVRPGFEVYELEQVEVPLGGVAAIDVELARGPSDRVVATAPPTVELTSAEVAERVLPGLLNDLPLPLAAVGADADGVLAMRVNGIRWAGPPEQLPRLPSEAVSALRVLRAAPTAGEPGGWTPIVDLVTPAGGNTVRGTVAASVSGGTLAGEAEPPPAGLAAASAEDLLAGSVTVGGRVRWDALWYYLAGGSEDAGYDQVERASDLSGGDATQRWWPWERERRWGHGRITWRPAPRHRFSLWGFGDLGEEFDRPQLGSATPDADLRADADRLDAVAGLVWQALTSQEVMLEVAAGGSESWRELTAAEDDRLLLDGTSDGRASGGLAGAPLVGGLGVDGLREEHDGREAWFRLGVLAPGGHQLALGARGELDRRRWRTDPAASGSDLCLPLAPGAVEVTTGGTRALGPDCVAEGGGAMGLLVPDAALARTVARDGELWALQPPGVVEEEATRLGLFVEDEWRAGEHVTLRLGLRADLAEIDTTWSDRPLSTPPRRSFSPGQSLAPRLAAVWDPTRRGTMRLFLGLGRIVEPRLDAARLAFGRTGADLWVLEPGADPQQPARVLRVAEGAPWWIDPDLEPGAEDEFVLGGEAVVGDDLVVGLRYVRRRLDRPVVVTSLDRGGSWLVANAGTLLTEHPLTGEDLERPVRVPDADRSERVLALTARRRLAGGWQLQASLEHHRREGTLPLTGAGGDPLAPFAASPLLAPDLFAATADGRLPGDRSWQARLLGSHTFDFGPTVGVAAHWASGAPLSRLGAASGLGLDARFVEPRGTAGRGPDLLSLDLHLGWPMRLRAIEGEVVCDVVNLLDRQDAVVLDERWTVLDEVAAVGLDVHEQRTNPLWGEALLRQPPRRVELGFRFHF